MKRRKALIPRSPPELGTSWEKIPKIRRAYFCVLHNPGDHKMKSEQDNSSRPWWCLDFSFGFHPLALLHDHCKFCRRSQRRTVPEQFQEGQTKLKYLWLWTHRGDKNTFGVLQTGNKERKIFLFDPRCWQDLQIQCPDIFVKAFYRGTPVPVAPDLILQGK